MKTIIPAVIAIMLAAAAVFAVRKLVKPKDGDGEKTMVSVVAAAREIAANGQKIQFDMLRERGQMWLVYGCTGVSVALFALFYPALAGVEVSRWFSTHFLKWLPDWPL